MDCSMPGFPVLHHLPELAQTHVPLSQWCHPTIWSSVIPVSSCLQSFPASESFLMSQHFTSGGQRIGASTSVLPMNIQDWFPSGFTGLISLHSKRLSGVFSNTTVQKHQFFGTSLLYGPTLTSTPDYWKNCSFDYNGPLLAKSVCSFTACLTLCDPMDFSTPGFPIHHQLREPTQNSCPLHQWCHPTISSFVIPFSSRLHSFPASGSFPMSWFFASGVLHCSFSFSISPSNEYSGLISFRIDRP